jgi:hypothetical protein
MEYKKILKTDIPFLHTEIIFLLFENKTKLKYLNYN